MRSGTTHYVRQQRLYRQWADFCAILSVNPTLQDTSNPRIKILHVYGHQVRHAKYSKLRMDQLGKELVSRARGVIATAHLLDGLPDPRKPADSQAHTRLDKRLTRQLKTYGIEDPPVRREKAIPLGIVHSIVAKVDISSDTRAHQISNLITIGFYFCLSSCEYTKCTGHRWMVQFRPLMDFVFFVRDFILPGDAPAKHFRQAAQIVITLNNQKNTIRGKTISHFCSESATACPFKAGIEIFPRLQEQGCDPTTPISDYPSNHGFRSVNASNIIAVIRAKCLQVGAAILGIALDDVGTHSIHSGGAMAIHLVNVPDWTLISIGRWQSLGFMVYIQQQISSFSMGVSVKMRQQPWFWHL